MVILSLYFHIWLSLDHSNLGPYCLQRLSTDDKNQAKHETCLEMITVIGKVSE